MLKTKRELHVVKLIDLFWIPLFGKVDQLNQTRKQRWVYTIQHHAGMQSVCNVLRVERLRFLQRLLAQPVQHFFPRVMIELRYRVQRVCKVLRIERIHFLQRLLTQPPQQFLPWIVVELRHRVNVFAMFCAFKESAFCNVSSHSLFSTFPPGLQLNFATAFNVFAIF
eukprot:g7653.t1